MPKVKLTEIAVQKFKAPPGDRTDYFDASLPGFALRVAGSTDRAPAGRKTWTLFYRFGGAQRRLTLEPPYPALSLADARRKAGDALAMLAEGKDPGAAKAKLKADSARAPDTVANVVEIFMRRHLEGKKHAPRYIEETRRNFRNHVLPRWAERDINTISRRDVIELLDAVMDKGSVLTGDDGKRRRVPGGPIAANRVLAGVRTLFNFALRRGIIESTPVALVERPGAETTRARTLDATELREIWPRLVALGYPFGPFLQLVILTGQRREEVAGMRWTNIDLSAGTWTLAAEATKAGRSHVVPLSGLALQLLEVMPRKMGPAGGALRPSAYVFTTTGSASISGFSAVMKRLRGAGEDGAGSLPPWTIHDLRRTVATEMGRLGISRFIIGKVLNHADRSVTGIYDRHAYVEEKRHAMEAWAQYLESLTRPPQENVVALHANSP